MAWREASDFVHRCAPELRRLDAGGADWPTQLDDLGAEAPDGLWLAGAGELRLLALRSIAIVGAREASAYGVTVALLEREHSGLGGQTRHEIRRFEGQVG